MRIFSILFILLSNCAVNTYNKSHTQAENIVRAKYCKKVKTSASIENFLVIISGCNKRWVFICDNWGDYCKELKK